MKKLYFTIFLLSFINNNVSAETIVADRPGFSTGTYSVQPGVFNIEMGYNYTFDKISTNFDTHNVPLFELRTGITENIEFNFLFDGWSILKDNTQIKTSDISLGGKYKILKNNSYNITLMTLITLPTGSETIFYIHSISPLIGLLWDYNINEIVSLFGTFQSSTYKDISRIYDLQSALGASFTHTNAIGSFIEIYSILPSSSQVTKEYVIDGGFTYLFNENIQLDINGGLGLTKESNNFFGFGLAVQF